MMEIFHKKSLLPVLCVLVIAAISGCKQNNTRKLVWQDEFEIAGKPDLSKWTYDTAHGCPNCGWGNNEKQYYTDRLENVVIEDGVLKIHGKREKFDDAEFTSGRIHSKGKFSVKYGRIEARAKVPEGVGTWPAIWMLGSNIDSVGWPACGEIDIMEHRGSELNKIFATLHYPGYFGDNANGHFTMVENANKDFHIYAAEWNADSISLFVDKTLIHKAALTKDMPYHQDFYILVNMAIGGNFAGAVDTAFNNATFEIDYIRVYE